MNDADLHGPWSAIVRAPMVRMATPFALGVGIGHMLSPSSALLFPLFGAASLPAFVLVLSPQPISTRWHRGAVLMLWFLTFGMTWQSLMDPARDPLAAAAKADAKGAFLVRIDAVNRSSDKALHADVSIRAIFRDGSAIPVRGRAMVTLLDNEEPWPDAGDVLALDAALEPIARVPDPGGFDRAAWASSRGITHELFAPAQRWHVVGEAPRWSDAFRHARESVSDWLNATALGVRERALVKALVLGQRDELDPDQSAAFARSGTVHVLAVSGMHVGLIYAALSFLLGWWGGGPGSRVARGVLILLALWAYAGLTGAAPSVLRASFMFSLFTLAGMGRRRPDHLNSLFAAVLFLLLWDPGMLRHAGFQLSVLAVLGIITFYRPISSLWSPSQRLLRNAWSLLVVSFAAQLLTAPLAIWQFKAFPVWFLPANLIVVTGVTFAVFGGVALIVLHRVPWLGDALAWCMQWLLTAVDHVSAWFADLPHAYPAVRIGAVDMLVMYALIVALAAELVWKWRRARLAALGCTALLILLAAGRSKHRAEEVSFVVYDDHRSMMACMLTGRELVVMATNDSVLDDPFTKRRIERHERSIGADSVAIVVQPEDLAIARAGSTWLSRDQWRSGAFDVRFVTGRFQPHADLDSCDAVVFHDIRVVRDEVLNRCFKARHWVLAATLPGYLKERLTQKAQELGIQAHSIRDQGAFVLRSIR